MTSYTAKPADIERKWYVIDARDVVLGRLSSRIAMILRGKHKPMYTPSMDCGDNVIVINAEKVAMTGNKRTDEVYYRHTGHPGGIKETTADKILTGRFPERVIQMAVKRMMPGGNLSRAQLKKLHVYAGETHPHDAQKPEAIDFGAANAKNKR